MDVLHVVRSPGRQQECGPRAARRREDKLFSAGSFRTGAAGRISNVA